MHHGSGLGALGVMLTSESRRQHVEDASESIDTARQLG